MARAATAAKAVILGFHERGGGVWVPSLRASAALAAALDVAARFDSPSLLPRLFLLRATKCYPLLG
jgi:hypothetical protein